MELLQLRYFLESANTGSFAETARKFMVPQSSVSLTVKRLEKELNCQLFDRQTNKLILNSNGKKLQHSLKYILGELDQVTAELSRKVTGNEELRVLASVFRSTIMAAIIHQQKQYPELKFTTLFDMNADDQYEDYDLIVTLEPIHTASFESVPLWKRKLRLTIASDSVLCGRTLTLENLKDQPFVITSQNSYMYQLLQHACQQVGFTPKIAMEVNDIKYYNNCVKAGMGIGLTRGRVSPGLGIDLLNISDFNEWVTCYICYKKPVKSMYLQDFIDYLMRLDP